MKNKFLLFGSALLLCGISHVFAGDDAKNEITTTTPEVPAFRHGAQEVQLVAGSLFSISGNTDRRPELNYAIEGLRYGYMFDDVHGSGFLRGNDEFVAEAFAGQVYTGPGHTFEGGLLAIRHNFVQDGCPLVPYIQIGGGGLGNDIYHDQTQRRIGEDFEFMLHGGLGVRWMITDRWAVSAELEYRHISNAGLASRNSGLDSAGGVLGVNFLY